MNLLETDKGFILSCIGIALFGVIVNICWALPGWIHKASLPVTNVWF